ncbi:MAG: spore germination protein [Syntrophomonadaceae bacterium]|nr:spore germination protein [Syntrophomonadaceae bacterium]
MRKTTGPEQVPLPHDYMPVSARLADNEKILRQDFNNTTDIVFRQFFLAEIKCLAVWIDGVIDSRISHDLFRAFMLEIDPDRINRVPPAERTEFISKHLLPFHAVTSVTDLVELRRWVLMHKLILLIDGSAAALVLDAESSPNRGISEPTLESVVSGPRDAFVENIRTNTALIRNRLGDYRLKSENFILGRRSNTLVTMMYVEDLARPEIIEEVRQRMGRVDTDGLLDIYYLKDFLSDEKYSLFPLMKETERPDKVCGDLLEGRFALIADGSPQVLTAPSHFIEFFQAAEDYYMNPILVFMLRSLRFIGFIMACILPALYVAVSTFHPEMIPIPLIFSVAGSRETVPFPAFIEAMLMLLVFELLVEAGIRLPRVVGGAVNIVGALIVGQAAVEAGIVSPILVIIVAATAIASFAAATTYQIGPMTRPIRLVFLIAAGVLGLYGVGLVALAMLVNIASLRSFGVAYLAPLAPIVTSELGDDVLFRVPKWAMGPRPKLIAGADRVREGSIPPGTPTESNSSDEQ